MALEKNKKEEFSTYGQEAYALGKDKKDEKKPMKEDEIILNILQEEEISPSDAPIEFSGEKRFGIAPTGNPVVDLYHQINLFFIKKSRVKVDAKATFFHLLGVMINAGIPMVKALKSLANQTEKTPRLQFIIQDMAEDIVAGSSLSRSLAKYQDVFNEQEIGMIQAGEASGQISRVLETVAHDAEKASSIRKKVKSALMYPAVILTLLVVVIIVMLVYVIPQLSELFTASEQELPLITRIIVGLSDFLINQKLVLILAVVALFGVYAGMKKIQKGRYILDLMKLKIPIFGEVLQKSYLSRFARSLNNLLDSSVSILKTLEITARSVGNEVYKKKLFLSMEDVRQGIPLAENLQESELFPPMLVSMIEVGEKTAQLDTIMGQVADFYEDEVDTTVAGLSKIIEPIMLIIIGITVGAVVAAIILPIMQLTNIAGSL